MICRPIFTSCFATNVWKYWHLSTGFINTSRDYSRNFYTFSAVSYRKSCFPIKKFNWENSFVAHWSFDLVRMKSRWLPHLTRCNVCGSMSLQVHGHKCWFLLTRVVGPSSFGTDNFKSFKASGIQIKGFFFGNYLLYQLFNKSIDLIKIPLHVTTVSKCPRVALHYE